MTTIATQRKIQSIQEDLATWEPRVNTFKGDQRIAAAKYVASLKQDLRNVTKGAK